MFKSKVAGACCLGVTQKTAVLVEANREETNIAHH